MSKRLKFKRFLLFYFYINFLLLCEIPFTKNQNDGNNVTPFGKEIDWTMQTKIDFLRAKVADMKNKNLILKQSNQNQRGHLEILKIYKFALLIIGIFLLLFNIIFSLCFICKNTSKNKKENKEFILDYQKEFLENRQHKIIASNYGIKYNPKEKNKKKSKNSIIVSSSFNILGKDSPSESSNNCSLKSSLNNFDAPIIANGAVFDLNKTDSINDEKYLTNDGKNTMKSKIYKTNPYSIKGNK